MLYVFIDTNVLLRFYAYSDDTLAEVEKLSALITAESIKLLVTQQVVDEHARNRDRELSESLKRLDQIGTSVQIPRFAEHHAPAAALQEAMKNAKNAKSELIEAVRAELKESGLRADRLIESLFTASNILSRSEDIIARARLRKDLGNPPGKRDSLGDQINWEILLDCVSEGEDLHVITRDGDFRSGLSEEVANFFLRGEWERRKKASLYIYAGLGEFTKIHFPEIKVPSDAIKAGALSKLIKSTNYSQTHAAIAELEAIFGELSKDDALTLLKAVTYNSQISDIINDDDVKSFYKKLYDNNFMYTSFELDVELEEISDIFNFLASAEE